MEKSEENAYGFSKNLERADNMPIMISRYGFREEMVDGKIYLIALTKEAYIDVLNNDAKIPKEHLNKLVEDGENGKTSYYMYTTFSSFLLFTEKCFKLFWYIVIL